MTNDRQQDTITGYIKKSIRSLELLEIIQIEILAEAISKARDNHQTVFLAGNGGSASTASHFATDLGVGSLKFGKSVKALSLNDNNAVITAVSNDLSFESVFGQQLGVLGERGDILILFSASGNSPNLIEAASRAEKLGIKVFSVTGFDGGNLKLMTENTNIHVTSKTGEYGLVEDIHLAICHMVTECIRIEY